MPTQPIIKNKSFNEQEVKRIYTRRLGMVVWVSFLAAAVQTMVFFALFDPVYLWQLSSWHLEVSHWQGYAMGFACFWLFLFVVAYLVGITMAYPRSHLAKKTRAD